MRLKAMYLCSNRSSGCFAGNMFKDQKRWTCTMHSGSKTIQLVNFTDNPIFVGRSFKLSWFLPSACNKTYVGQVGGGWYGLKVPRWIFLSSRLNCCGFLFPGCRLVFGKNGRCVFKNIGKDCLFRPLSLSLFATMVQATRGQVAFLLLSLNCGLQRGADSGDFDFLTSSLFSKESIF